MISFVPRLVPAYTQAWEQGYHTIHKTVALLRGIVQLSISFSTYWNKMQCESRAIQIIQYHQNYSGVLLISHTNEEF